MAAVQEMAGDRSQLLRAARRGSGARRRWRSLARVARVVVNYSRSADEAQETADLVRDAGSEALVIQAKRGQRGGS